MSNDNCKIFSELASCLDEIQLELYYTAVRSTHFANLSTYRFVPKNDVTSGCEIQDCFQKGVILNEIPWDNLAEYYLIIQLAGELTTIDEVNLNECRFDKNKLEIELAITKVESQDGVPVPINAFVLLPLNETILVRKKLNIASKGYYRSFSGELSLMKEVPVEAVSVSFVKDR